MKVTWGQVAVFSMAAALAGGCEGTGGGGSRRASPSHPGATADSDGNGVPDNADSAPEDPQCWEVVCGDAVVCGDEDCDDGGESAACDAACTVPTCGDGTTNTTAGETCDDGGTADGDGCSASCLYEPSGGWITIPGGTFMMGSESVIDVEAPIHQVAVPTFEMLASEVTVSGFQACVDAGRCTDPSVGEYYNWGIVGRENHPVNGVSWVQASDYCGWVGGRLPSEAEWESAARSGGKDVTYPWGDHFATCDLAVMTLRGMPDCGERRTWAVCSKSAGNTDHGLCDMAGSLYEWVQDGWHYTYDGASTDGSAWVDDDSWRRVTRGGSGLGYGRHQRTTDRYDSVDGSTGSDLGFRCARPRS